MRMMRPEMLFITLKNGLAFSLPFSSTTTARSLSMLLRMLSSRTVNVQSSAMSGASTSLYSLLLRARITTSHTTRSCLVRVM